MKDAYSLAALCVLALAGGCSRDAVSPDSDDGAGDGNAGAPTARDASSGAGGRAAGDGASGAGGQTSGSGGAGGHAAGGAGPTGNGGNTAVRSDPSKVGVPGCGFGLAAFCDTFEAPGQVPGRGGELDGALWSVGRGKVQLSNVRAIGIGMAEIPQCRDGLPSQVWPNDDCLICQPNSDILSAHFLAAAAAQNYGQHSYRIRQPFAFEGRTGKIVFDGTVSPQSPLHGWISVAVTEDPMLMPGYSIQSNDEGSIIPKNAVEVHFVNTPGDQGVQVRNVHVFRDFVDTVYSPESASTATWKAGKLNRYEISVSPAGVQVAISPHSEDGVTVAAPTAHYKVDTSLPFTRGWVQLSVHNHATLKYTYSPNQIDAAIAMFDNVGFDGDVISSWREYEVPNALVKFIEDDGDPHNVEHVGYDIGYVVGDAAQGPKQKLLLKGVDLSNVESARLSFTATVDYLSNQYPRDQHTLRARLNGGTWLERKLTAAEAALLQSGPTTVDPSGTPLGHPGSQGRYALMIDVPHEQLVAGDNVLEFVSANVPTGNPPVVYNINLVMKLAE